jgi:phosphate transport system permease protein
MESIFNQKTPLLPPSKTQFHNIFFENLFRISLFITIISLALIAVYIFWNGAQLFTHINLNKFFASVNWEPVVRKEFGILPMIIASFYITFASVLVSVPIGVACAIYAAELAGGSLKRIIQIAIQILAGTPSVVYGLIGIALIVPFIQQLGQVTGYSILAAIIILSIMILPTIVSISQDAIQSVPNELKQASLALGATHFQTITKIILPVARPGIITAVVLAISRAFGEGSKDGDW